MLEQQRCINSETTLGQEERETTTHTGHTFSAKQAQTFGRMKGKSPIHMECSTIFKWGPSSRTSLVGMWGVSSLTQADKGSNEEGRHFSLPRSYTIKPLERQKEQRQWWWVDSRLLTCLRLGNRIREFLELGNKETIHIVGVRVEATGRTQSGVEAPFSKARKTFLAKV